MEHFLFKEPSPAVPVPPFDPQTRVGFRVQPNEPRDPETNKVAPISPGLAPVDHRAAAANAPQQQPNAVPYVPGAPLAVVRYMPPVPQIPVRATMPPAWFNFNNTSVPAPPMSHKSRLLLAGSAPGVSFTARNGPYNHMHPANHAIRQWCYLNLLNNIASDALNNNRQVSVTDIGGHHSMPRYHPLAPVVHATKPYVDSADWHRSRDPAYCCECLYPNTCQRCNAPTYFMSVHSIYYLPKETICAMVQQAPLFAAFHVFDGVRGHHQELSWSRSGNNIIMQQLGDPHHYMHNNIDWIFHDTVFDHPNGYSMCWRIEAHVSGTYCATFRACPRGTVPAPAYYPDFTDSAYSRALQGLHLHEPNAKRISLWLSLIHI